MLSSNREILSVSYVPGSVLGTQQETNQLSAWGAGPLPPSPPWGATPSWLGSRQHAQLAITQPITGGKLWMVPTGHGQCLKDREGGEGGGGEMR